MSAFDQTRVTITRHRQSETQGEVTVEYDGQRIERYGDNIQLINGEFRGEPDEFWIAVARREAIARGLATLGTYPKTDNKGRVEHSRVFGIRTVFASGQYGNDVRADGKGGLMVRGYYWSSTANPGSYGPYSTRKAADRAAGSVVIGQKAPDLCHVR